MKSNKGITLIALVVTIIVLLILAGISIAMLTGSNGVLTKATESEVENARGEACDRINLALNGIFADLLDAEYNNEESIPNENDGQFILEENGMDDETLKNSIGSYTAEYHKDIIEAANGETADGEESSTPNPNSKGTVVKITWNSPDVARYGKNIEGSIERIETEKEKVPYRVHAALISEVE